MTTTPPGWYDDGHGALRWWDGSQWTEHVAQPDPEASDAPTEAEIVAAQLGFGDDARTPAAGAPSSEASAQLAATAPAVAHGSVSAAASGAPTDPGHPDSSPAPGAAAYVAGEPQGPYPAGEPHGGAFTAATQPRTSKLWIVWVVLGVVLLGIVIAAAVLIPLLILSGSAGGGAAQTDDERAAVAAVQLYDDAWQQGDCDALTAATTEEFRVDSGFTDCSAFEDQAAAFNAGLESYEIEVTDVETVQDDILVTTVETYSEIGEGTEPTPGSSTYEYTVVESDGAWFIDAVGNG